jgi:hypothetical protein
MAFLCCVMLMTLDKTCYYQGYAGLGEKVLMLFTTGTTHNPSWQVVYGLVCIILNLSLPTQTCAGSHSTPAHGPGEGIVVHRA